VFTALADEGASGDSCIRLKSNVQTMMISDTGRRTVLQGMTCFVALIFHLLKVERGTERKNLL
jgi:hypothetical protein